jgi:hypothetical protein
MKRPDWAQARTALADSVVLAVASLAVGLAAAWLDQRVIQPRIRPLPARPMLVASRTSYTGREPRENIAAVQEASRPGRAPGKTVLPVSA